MMTNTSTDAVKNIIVADIATSTLPVLKREVEKLNKRAARLGLEPITVTELRRFSRKTSDRKIPMVSVEVEGNAPRLSGWGIAAAVEHTSAGNIIRALDGAEYPHLREVKATCDHCNVNRNRKDTYVLKNTDGRVARVGSTCLKDFTGNSVEAAVCAAAYFAEIVGRLEDEEFCLGGGGTWDADLEEFLGYVAMSVRADGWCSRSKAREGYGEATADQAWGALMSPPRPNVERAVPTAEDKARAARALEHVRADLNARALTNGLSDYQHNLRLVLGMDSIEAKHAGLAASVLPYYDRDIEQRQKREARADKTANSCHVGEVKQRLEFGACEVLGVRYIDGEWGVTTLITFVTADGNVIKWFASRAQYVEIDGKRREIEPGDVVNVKATVKKHGEYNGVKETQVNRAVLS